MATGTQLSPGECSGGPEDVGLDWITYIDRARRAPERVLGVALEIAADAVEPVHDRKPFDWMGYSGWMQGALRVGRRGHCAYIQLSGRLASSCATRLGSLSGLATRLDVQATWRLSAPQPLYGQRWLRPSGARGNRRESRPPRVGRSTDSRGLFLGTVGDRTKARYLRVYDKGVESGTAAPGEIWRTELEAKRTLGPAMFREYLAASEKAAWCYDSLVEQWQRSGCGWPRKSSSRPGYGLAVPSEPPSDAEKLARWARRSVAPAMQRLTRAYDRETVLEMLGLHLEASREE